MSIDLGSALIRFREDIGLTRKELYEKVGISKFRLSQLENNNNKNSERAIKNIQKGIKKGGVKDSTIFKLLLGWVEFINETAELLKRYAKSEQDK